jgi:lipopolysaccharide transport system permease protein
LEILPWVSLGSALFHLLVSLFVWLVFYLLFWGLPKATVLLFPLAILPLVFLTLGLSWFLASLGVYLRDVSQIIGILLTMLMFLSPIFYPLAAIPEDFRGLLLLNPLTLSIEYIRDVLIWGRIPQSYEYSVYLLGCAAMFIAGFAWFQMTRKGFADVL